MSKTVVVTGSHGFLGRHAALEMKNRGYYVIGIGRGKWSEEEYIEYGHDIWIEDDITLQSLKDINRSVDVIVHCAGSASVKFSIENPLEDFEMTVDTTLHVLEYMRLYQPDAILIYPSSVAVYGNVNALPFKEDFQLNPVSPYGNHKLIVEQLCRSYEQSYKLKIGIIRFFSIYGEGLRKQLIWDACRKFHEQNKEAVFYGTGNETRDWIHVKDAARLIGIFSERVNGLYIINGGSGEGVSVRDVVRLIRDNFGYKTDIVFNSLVRSGDPEHYLADITKAIKMDWQPEINFKNGIKSYVQWFKRII